MPAVPGQMRTVYTEEQKSMLIASYESGLKTTKIENHAQIRELAEKLNLTFTNVKNFIDNHHRKLVNPATARPRLVKKRLPSKFNIFVSEEKKKMKGLNPRDQFRTWGEEWRSLPTEVKESYGAKRNTMTLVPTNQKERDARVNSLHRQMEATVFEFESLGVQTFSVSIDLVRKEKLITGTQKGKQFLQQNSDIIDKFNSACPSVPVNTTTSTSTTTSADEAVLSRGHLIKQVRIALNLAYAKSMQLPQQTTRFPYMQHKNKQVVVDGLPLGLVLKENISMSSYTELKQLLEVIPSLKFHKNLDVSTQPNSRIESLQVAPGPVNNNIDKPNDPPVQPILPLSDLLVVENDDEDDSELWPSGSNVLDMMEEEDSILEATLVDRFSSNTAEASTTSSTEKKRKQGIMSRTQKRTSVQVASTSKSSSKKSKQQEESVEQMTEEYPFEEILKMKWRNGKKGYIVKWEGPSPPSWTAAANIPLVIRKEFHSKVKSS